MTEPFLPGKFKACVRYFSLLLKDKCIFSLFQTKYIEKKFNLSCFFFPVLHEHLEHVYMRPEVNSNRFEISLQGKISLWCEVTSLSVFT